MSEDESNKDKFYVEGNDFDNKLFANELDHILGEDPEHKTPEGRKKKHLVGLAFSGGGIRSATFCLGVMQALAKMGWLQKFHYLSTVSGGGYIGSSLTWLLHKTWKKDISYGVDEKNFPFRKYHGEKQSDEEMHGPRSLTRHLRQHGKYLTPGDGITGMSLLAVILRGMSITLMTYGIPALLLFALLLQTPLFGDAQKLYEKSSVSFTTADQNGEKNGVGNTDAVLLKVLQHHSYLGDSSAWKISVFQKPELPGINPLLIVSLGLLLLFAVWAVIYAAMTFFRLKISTSYHLRRLYEKKAKYLLIGAFVLAVLGSLPIVLVWLGQFGEEVASSMTLGGLIASAVAMMKSRNKDEGKIPVGVLMPVALLLLPYGILLLLMQLGLVFDYGLGHADPYKWYCLGGASAVAVILGLFVNINYISIHRYYRDRLMELYMPDVSAVISSDSSRSADEANRVALDKMCDFAAGVQGPYHLVNTNMVTENSTNKKLGTRGGANFVFSPCYCGSEVTGWMETKYYMNGRMNLATAMAISGAAVDPHGAVGGEGLTKNRSLSFMMGLFNLRLGYWAPNPKKENVRTKYLFPRLYAQGFKELFARGLDENSDFVHLADGGHYENLALYELIRRRVKTIIVCDGGADPDYTFDDFANFVEKVRVDFGVDIKMPSFLAMCPKPDLDESGNKKHPYGVDLAEKGYVVGSIAYADGTYGKLIYIKTTLIGKLPKDIYGYKSAHPEFPDETTADQFFDEKQFEAYRELGYRIGKSMMKDEELKRLFSGLKKVRA